MKKAQVIWSTEALVDLETIYDFLASKSQQAAQRVVGNILSRTKQIETFPESGACQLTLKTTDKEYLYLVEGNYKIIYNCSNDLRRGPSYLPSNPCRTKINVYKLGTSTLSFRLYCCLAFAELLFFNK